MGENHRIKRQKYLIIRRLPRKLGRFFYAWFQCFDSLGIAEQIRAISVLKNDWKTTISLLLTKVSQVKIHKRDLT